MNFSKTTVYSLRILGFMAMDETKLYNAEVLFENTEVPFRYLRKQLTKLVKSGLLISQQGKSGGYKIARPVNKITLWDIVQATGELQHSHECIFGFDTCVFGDKCSLHGKWIEVQDTINEMLKNTTLGEMKETRPERLLYNII